jgi:hypothetical protein
VFFLVNVHVLVLHFNPWVEASPGGLLVPEVSTAQLLSTSVFALKYEYELNCQEKSKFVNSTQNKRLFPSGIALSSTDLVQFHGTLFDFHLTALSVFTFFPRISNFFDLSITEET